MEEKILELASSQGIWTVLTMFLIFYILKTQEKRDAKQESREIKYQQIVSDLTEQLYIIKHLQGDIKEIKSYLVEK